MFGQTSQFGPIAIDVGGALMKMIQVDRSRNRPVVSAVYSRRIPCELSGAARQEFIREAIASGVKNGSFHGRQVVTALQPEQFEIKSLRMPRIPVQELASAIQFEAEDRFGFGADAGQFRFLSAGDVRQGNEVKEELIVFGARTDRVGRVIQDLESVNLEPVAIDAAPCAMARSFTRFLRRDEDADSVNVFLDIGNAHANLVITRGQNVAFVKVFDIGGARFDQAIASRLDMTLEEANDVRRSTMQAAGSGRGDDGAESTSVPESVREQIDDAIRPILEQLAREVTLCLRYFAVTFRGKRPGSLTFVGGEAFTPLLVTMFNEQTDIPCMVGDPLRGMGITSGAGRLGAPTLRPAWSVALGLALRGSAWASDTADRAGATVR
jgi:type IV pilus assembly protein PilM